MQKRNKQRDHYENRYNHNSYYAPYKKNSIDRKPINQPWWAKIYHPIIAGSIDGTDTKPHDRAIQRALEANCKSCFCVPYFQMNLSPMRLGQNDQNVHYLFLDYCQPRKKKQLGKHLNNLVQLKKLN